MTITHEEIVRRTNHIPSSVYEPEQALWLKYLKDLPGEPLIVDFGTGWGKSAVSLALACPQATVLTFDPGEVYVMHGNVATINEYTGKVQDYIREAGVGNVHPFVMDSMKTNPQRFIMEHGKKSRIDVLNIDSDHTYESTLREMREWIPLVKDGGIVMFHDFEHPHAPGVGQAIHELVSYKDGDQEYFGKEFNLELIEKAVHPKVTTALFIKH